MRPDDIREGKTYVGGAARKRKVVAFFRGTDNERWVRYEAYSLCRNGTIKRANRTMPLADFALWAHREEDG